MKRLPILAFTLALFSCVVAAPAQNDDINSRWPQQDHPPAKSDKPLSPDLAIQIQAATTVVDLAVSAGFNVANRNLGAEPSLAVNPTNTQQIVVLSFAGSFWDGAGPAPLWLSNNGGLNWAQVLSIPEPRTVIQDNCPCDQAPDFGQDGIFYATFLRSDGNIYTGQSTNPANLANWSWNPAGAGMTMRTNRFGVGNSDQPWLWTGRDPANANNTNVYVAYDDFTGFGIPLIRNAASLAVNPPSFPLGQDRTVNTLATPLAANPGNRITVATNGKVYNIHSKSVNLGGGAKLTIYIVNRSTDQGQTWTVAGGGAPGGGIVVATGPAKHGFGFKLGGNNQLLGSITAIAVDPNTEVVYAAYGLQDPGSGVNKIRVRKLMPNGAGGYNLGGPQTIVFSNIEQALPAIAVLPSGEAGLMFTTFSGTTYQVRFQQSADGFATLSSTSFPNTFTNFAPPSPLAPSGNLNDRQRILGDYEQIKAAGNTYYGTFAARGSAGLNQQSVDPYFFKADGLAPQANEACCKPDGTCQNLPPASCRSIRGVPQGNGTACATANCGAAGACCLAGGVCNLQTRANCLAAGGTFQGTGSACAAAQACYLSNGTCVMLPPICCDAQGGTPQGPGSTCAANQRCCLPDRTCRNSDPNACALAGGTPGGAGSTCADTPNEQCCLPDGSCANMHPACCTAAGGATGGPGSACGAAEQCCLPDRSCINTDPVCCAAVGGMPGGPGTACGALESCCLPSGVCINTDPACCTMVFPDPNNPPAPDPNNPAGIAGGPGTACAASEACCLAAGECRDLDPNCCAGLGGTAEGVGTSCTVAQRCCLPDGTCQDLDPLCCARLGGAAGGANTFCTLQACCLPDGSCIDTDPACCAGLGGVVHVGPCSANECPQPEACCLPNGNCVDTLPGDCAAQGGTPQGPGTTCATLIPPCPQLQACCFPGGGCDDLDPNTCVTQGGTPKGPGTTCATLNPPCPQPCSRTIASVSRRVFYNNSFFDSAAAACNTLVGQTCNDNTAIATDKTALSPGGTATTANYISHSRSINGLMIDVTPGPGCSPLPAGPLAASNFEFRIANSQNLGSYVLAAAPTSINVTPGGGTSGSDRIVIIWANNAIPNTRWLRVLVKSNASGGSINLGIDNIFYYGIAIGESLTPSGSRAIVNSTDEIDARNHPHNTLSRVPVATNSTYAVANAPDARYDYDKSSTVSATDEIIARNNPTNSLNGLLLLNPAP